MVHTAASSHTDVWQLSLIGPHDRPTPVLGRIVQDQKGDEATPWISSRKGSRVNGLRWQELIQDTGYIWPRHLQSKRARYSTEHFLATSASRAARGKRWEETYVERCLAESGRKVATLGETRRSQVMQCLLDYAASAPLEDSNHNL